MPKIFGKPLYNIGQSNGQLPSALLEIFNLLESSCPTAENLFSIEQTELLKDEKILKYVSDINSGVQSPLCNEDSPQVVAGLLLFFFQNLPHPVFPPTFFYTWIRVGLIQQNQTRIKQYRVVLNAMPLVSRTLCSKLLSLLNHTEIDKTVLAKLFARFVFRASPALVYSVPVCVEKIMEELIEHADYLNFSQNSLYIMDIPCYEQNNFQLKGTALSSYNSVSVPNAVPLHVGDTLTLLTAEFYDFCWLEVVLPNGQQGLVPASCVEVVPIPAFTLPTNEPASSDVADDNQSVSSTESESESSSSSTDASQQDHVEAKPVSTENPVLSSPNSEERMFKVVVLGCGGVGKSY